jgi:fucose permease
VLFLTLPLWKKYDTLEEGNGEQEDKDEIERSENSYKIPGVKYALLTFFAYCALESTTGLWGSSYLVESRGISPETAARFISFYYGGITVGRFITGFITMKYPTRTILRVGILIILSGVLCIALPLPSFMAILGLVLIGLGCAPVFPGMIHETPTRFGAVNSQSVIGIQMAFAYIGSTFMPAFFGLVGGDGRINIFPYYLLILVSILLFGTERINSMMKARHLLKTLKAKENVI